MFGRRSTTVNAIVPIFTMVLAFPLVAAAQRHGGAGMSSGSGLSGISRPTGVKQEDTLRDFHEAMALQATSQQTAEFQNLVKAAEAAKAELQGLIDQLHKENATLHREPIDQSLENLRSGSKRFQQGFSPTQKSGLKELEKRLARSDADLDQEQKRLDQGFDVKAAAVELSARAESLDKALADFYNQQLALGREMSITLASGQDETFNLPPTNHPVNIANRTIALSVSGTLSQTAMQGTQRTFRLELASDLSDLQQNITDVLRQQLDSSERCGQRVAIQEARLTPASPASLVFVRLHFERWTCSFGAGPQMPQELAEGDGTAELKVTASVDTTAGVKLVATINRVDAIGMMAESLRSGALGEDLRDAATQALLAAARQSSDFKVTLPLALQNSAVLQSARFQDTGVGTLILRLDGQLQISNEQADQLASQLNQSLSAQGSVGR